jgi:hypothetical protein
VTPIIFPTIFFSLHRLFYKHKGLQSNYLFAFSIPILAVSLAANLFINDRIDWSITGYITGFIAAAVFLLRPGALSGGKDYRRYLAYAGLLAAVTVTAILYFPSTIKLPADLDPTYPMKGWRALGNEVSALYEQQKKSGPVIITSGSCPVSAELSYYVKGHPGTYCGDMITRQAKKGGNVIHVMEGDVMLPSSINKAFENFDKKVFGISQKKSVIKAYSVFICYNFREPETAPTDKKQEQR